jgi:hypothetical protein
MITIAAGDLFAFLAMAVLVGWWLHGMAHKK